MKTRDTTMHFPRFQHLTGAAKTLQWKNYSFLGNLCHIYCMLEKFIIYYYYVGYNYHFVKSSYSSWKIIIKIAIANFAIAKHKISHKYHENKE